MEDKEFTVDELIDFLTRIKRDCGDYKIVIGERPVYTDEWTLVPQKKELIFRGYLYHEDIVKKASQLQSEITKSIEKFYRK